MQHCHFPYFRESTDRVIRGDQDNEQGFSPLQPYLVSGADPLTVVMTADLVTVLDDKARSDLRD
jgi:hypothetical protein